jgi:hypothetical protein
MEAWKNEELFWRHADMPSKQQLKLLTSKKKCQIFLWARFSFVVLINAKDGIKPSFLIGR